MDKMIVGHVNCLLYSYFSTAFIYYFNSSQFYLIPMKCIIYY